VSKEVKKIMGLEERELFAPGHRACAGCGEALGIRHTIKAAGENTIVVSATGCMEVISTPYPETAWKVPWIHAAFENNSAVASGIDASLKKQGKRDETNLLVVGGDGSTFDIGFGALSGAIERGHKFTYVCTDNEAYMNTGIQRSGASFPFSSTTTAPAGKKVHGKMDPKKPLPLIVAAHGSGYVATASIANLIDLNRKVKEALTRDGVSFVHVYSPCPRGWYHASDSALEIARLAIDTRVFPLYEIDNGVLKFTQKIEKEKAKPLEEYTKTQRRFKHLDEEDMKKLKEYVNDRYSFLEGIEGKKCFDTLY